MTKFEFYVGVLPQNVQEFKMYVREINTILPEEDHVSVGNSFDELDGYYTFCCTGTWSTYKAFAETDFVKSLEHFQED